MNQSAFSGPPPHGSRDYVPDELPHIESIHADREVGTEDTQSINGQHDVMQNEPVTNVPNTPMQSVGDIINSSSNQTQLFPDQKAVNPNTDNWDQTSNISGHKYGLVSFSYGQAIKYGIISAIIFAIVTTVVLY